MCRISAGGRDWTVALEPDGTGSHWFLAPDDFEAGEFEVEAIKEWPEPRVPQDIAGVLAGDAAARDNWDRLTVAARWDWIRWALAAKSPDTRKRRVESIPSRLRSGKRRPCCFDRNQRTLTDA